MGEKSSAGAAGLFGVLVGAAIQYYAGDLLEINKQRLQTQLSAYADFAKAQAAWQRADSEADQATKNTAQKDANLKIRDAAFRIAIFSPDDVVKAFAAFIREKHREDCAASPADLAVYQTLRARVSDKNVPNEDMAMVLFGCTLK
jgi:hypothetical protein